MQEFSEDRSMDFKTPISIENVEEKVPPKVDTINVVKASMAITTKKMTWKWYVCEETTVTSPENEAGLLTADQRCS